MRKLVMAATAAVLVMAGGVALAQQHGQGQFRPGQVQQTPHFAPETETESNTMSFLLHSGYQVVAGWEGTLVLQRGDRVYLCPYTQFREGNGGVARAFSHMCLHIRESVNP